MDDGAGPIMTIAPRAALSADEAARYARLALACVHREYPYHLVREVRGADGALAPRDVHPIFWGCYDWHSAVHGHWTMAAVARRFPAAPVSEELRAALARSFTALAVAGEEAYLRAHPAFERPYGLAWLCALQAELHAWDEGAAWAALLAPAAELSALRVAAWLERLTHPTRVGTHAQSAFAAALVLDAARGLGRDDVAARVSAAARRLHERDRGPAWHLEPSGEDFLSPGLGAAALMARVMTPPELAKWLDRALPELAAIAWAPPRAADRDDGRLVHLDGLAASRAWMARELAAALPVDDPRVGRLRGLADAHLEAAVDAIAAPSYADGHWLGTFVLRAALAAHA